jgi:hypothetical protein
MAQNLPSLDLVFEAAQKELDFQFEQINSLDTKASISLAAAGIMLAALISFFTQRPAAGIPGFLISGTLLISLSAILAVATLWVRRFERPPDLERLRDYYIAQTAEETKIETVDAILEAISRNSNRIYGKSLTLTASYAMLGLGIVAIAVFFVLFLLN